MLRLLTIPLVLVSFAAGAAEEPELVQSFEPLVERAARPSWDPQGDLMLFDRPGEDGLYDVHLRFATGADRCLTCDLYDLRGRHNFNARWHPSGDLLVFQSQERARRLGLDALGLTTPERSVHSDLWVLHVNGRDYWQITRAAEQGSAVLDPRFSWEGEELAWSQRLASRGGRWGEWQIVVARFGFKRGVVRITRPRRLEPASRPSLLLVQEYTPDERGLLISGNLDADAPATGLDLWEVDFRGASRRRLTSTPRSLEEYAHRTPRGEHLLFTSNAELFPREPPTVLEPDRLRELWIAGADGSDPRRLTFLNDPNRPGSPGEAWIGDFSFHRRGDRVAVHVISRRGREVDEAVWELVLPESFRRE